MVLLEKFYENVDVELDGTALSIRVKEQLDKVVEELPDEEQFSMPGEIYIGQQDWIQNILVEKSIDLLTGDPATVSAGDGNIIRGIDCENLGNSWYISTFVVDSLDKMSDDYTMGLISYKLSEWSYVWKEITNIPDWNDLGREERIENIGRLSPSRFPLGNREHEEYERSVDAEVTRLGFEDKLNAYQLRL